MLRFTSTLDGDINISDLQIALFNYIVAKQRKEDFLVRIEDLNKKKNIEKKDTEIVDILALFGLEYSQVVYQSQNIRFYSAMALQLLHEKKAFNCFCSDEWLKKKQNEAKKLNKLYMYDDACRTLPPELVIDNTNPFCIRINKPENSNNIDSFIVMNRDKTPTYNFASAIDDMLSDISIIICDEKYMNNTEKQEHIRDMLGYDKKIKYIYLPTLSEKISIKKLLEDGYLPDAISNYLISIALTQTPKEIFNLKDTQKWFSLDIISNSPTHFNLNELKHINKKHLKNLDPIELSRYVGFADEEIGKLAKIYLEEVSTTQELKSKIKPIFESKKVPKELQGYASSILKVLKDAPYFEQYDDFKKYIVEKSKLKEEDFSKTFYYLLTGRSSGLDIKQIYKYLKNYIGEIIK